MIVWFPFNPNHERTRVGTQEAAAKYAGEGRYVLTSFVPGVGWSGAFGIYDPRAAKGDVKVTELILDRHVRVMAFSVPEGGDTPPNGGPGRAA
jgi:hypothetical protein